MNAKSPLPFALGDVFCQANPVAVVRDAVKLGDTMARVHIIKKGYSAPARPNWTRSSQPTKQDLIRARREGTTVVLNLRDESPSEPAQISGLRYISFPIVDRGVPGMKGKYAPALSRIHAYKRTVLLAFAFANERVWVHCKHGAGRTGMFVAIAQIVADGRDVDDAVAEAKRYGITEEQEQFIRGFAAWWHALPKSEQDALRALSRIYVARLFAPLSNPLAPMDAPRA